MSKCASHLLAVRTMSLFALVALLPVAQAIQDDAPAYPSPELASLTPASVARVEGVDRVTLRSDDGETTVRLIGVRAPRRGSHEQVALDALKRMLEGERVYLVLDGVQGDVANSAAGYLFRAPDGMFVNLEMVRQGYAQAAAGRFSHRALFRHYERVAESAGKGVWGAAPVRRTSEGKVEPRPAEEGEQYADADTIVYVTRTGKKYHREDCPHLRFSRKPIRLGEAVRRYGPCGTCKPPVLRESP
jgi:endonuclease YncB( thermonuclease family)